MSNNQSPPYDDHDDGVIANNIFDELCRRDREDRQNNKEPAWHDITKLAEGLKGFENKKDVAYIAEEHLLNRRQFIERDRKNQNVRLTELGRKNCDIGINVPPSEHQIRFNLPS
jgi:hypothetical protein